MNVKASHALFFSLFLSFRNWNRMSHYRVVFFCHLFLAFRIATLQSHCPCVPTHTHKHVLPFPLMKSICKCTTRNEGSLSTHQWSLIFTWNEWQRNQRRLTFIVLKLYFQKSPCMLASTKSLIATVICTAKWNVRKCWNKHRGERIARQKRIAIPERYCRRHIWNFSLLCLFIQFRLDDFKLHSLVSISASPHQWPAQPLLLDMIIITHGINVKGITAMTTEHYGTGAAHYDHITRPREATPDWKLLSPASLDWNLGTARGMTTDFRLGFFGTTATNHFLCSYLLLLFLLSFCFYLSWCLMSLICDYQRYKILQVDIFYVPCNSLTKGQISLERSPHWPDAKIMKCLKLCLAYYGEEKKKKQAKGVVRWAAVCLCLWPK